MMFVTGISGITDDNAEAIAGGAPMYGFRRPTGAQRMEV